MSRNVVPFPARVKAKPENMTDKSDAGLFEPQDVELLRLRRAFDSARKNWHLEPAELPELNKINGDKYPSHG
jgi:hypothetical protein